MKVFKAMLGWSVLVVALLLIVAWSPAQGAISLGWNGTNTDTVKISGSVNHNDLEIQCEPGDKVTDFSTSNTSWTVIGLVKRGNVYFIKLTRTSSTANESVAVSGPSGRGKTGVVSLTLDGAVIDAVKGATFAAASIDSIPTMSTWGVLLLLVLLVGTAIWLTRKRKPALAG